MCTALDPIKRGASNNRELTEISMLNAKATALDSIIHSSFMFS